MAKDGGSHASTTSVPERGAVTMVSDAPMRSARSCMLVMPKPGSARSLRDAAAVVGDRQPEADGAHADGVHGDASRARVPDGVGQRLLRDAEDLAIDAAAERRQIRRSSARSAHRCCGARARPSARAPAATSSTCSCGRSAQTERRASTMCVRARSTAVSRLRATDGGSADERSRACSCIRMAANPCASVSWISRARRLRSSSTA